jgi:uncharacterized protein (TIGR03546 family)
MVSIIPKPIRKMIAVFRGQVSPVFIFLSIMLGFWFGLMPGWSGLHTVMVIVVLILNIHLGLFLLSGAIGKAACFAAAPLLFHIGEWVHSSLSVLLRLLASLPLIAITDFDKYSVAGALIVGPVVGAVGGLLLARSVIGFRRMLLKLEENSEQFKKWYSKKSVRILDRLLIGKRTKDAKSLFTAKLKIFRMPGVILAVIVIVILVAVTSILKDKAAKDYVVTKLTQINKAEVNLDEMSLSALAGAVSASGIEVTDPEKPQQNQVAIGKIAADIGMYELFLGRLVMEEVEVSDVQFGQARSEPGKVVDGAVEDKPSVFDPCDFKLEDLDISKLETYFKNAKAVKEWLGKIRKWLPESAEKEAEVEKEIPQGYLEYLDARAVTPASPRVLAKKVLLDKVQIPWSMFGNSRISLANLSDSVRVAELPVTLVLESHDTPASLSFIFNFAARENEPMVKGVFEGFDLSKLQESISSDAGLVFEKGTSSGQFKGSITKDYVDLTIEAAISGMKASAGGDNLWGLDSKTASEALAVMENMSVKLLVVGPLSEPRMAFDAGDMQGALKNALVEAGKARLAEEIDKQVEKQLGDKLPGEIGEVLKKPDGLLKGLGGLLGGDKKEEDK